MMSRLLGCRWQRRIPSLRAGFYCQGYSRQPIQLHSSCYAPSGHSDWQGGKSGNAGCNYKLSDRHTRRTRAQATIFHWHARQPPLASLLRLSGCQWSGNLMRGSTDCQCHLRNRPTRRTRSAQVAVFHARQPALDSSSWKRGGKGCQDRPIQSRSTVFRASRQPPLLLSGCLLSGKRGPRPAALPESPSSPATTPSS